MNLQKKRKIMMVILTFASILLLLYGAKKVQAAPEPSMRDGKIIIVVSSKGATSSIRYRTLGFTVSTQFQSGTVSAKGLTGPAAPPSPKVEIYLNDAEKVTGPVQPDGRVTTTYTIPEHRVKEALKGILDLDKIDTNTKIYFNAIFQTYVKYENGSEKILTPKITTWEGIVRDQGWGDPSVFEDYFNREVSFEPGNQPNTLYFDYNNDKFEVADLGTLPINNTVFWSGNVTETIIRFGKTYKLIGYYVESKLSGVSLPGATKKYLKDGYKVSDIINGTAKIPYGGLDVHVVYEIDEDNIPYKNTLYYKTGNSVMKVSELGEKLPSENITWATRYKNNPPGSIFGEGKVYHLQGYYIEAKDKNVKLQGVTSRYKNIDNVSDNDIINGKAIVVKGGLNIYIVFGDAPVPSPTPAPIPEPTLPPLEIPEGGSETQPVNNPFSTGIIRADNRDQEKFVVGDGIPTTESLYTQVNTTEYLIGYDFQKVVLIKRIPVKATKTYKLSWKDLKDPSKTITETETITQNITIVRACAYWKINSLEYYVIDSATIYNKTLPDGKCIMYPNPSYYKPPSLTTNKNDLEDYHVLLPPELGSQSTIDLGEEILTSPDSNRPVITPENFLYEANEKIGELQVRNDYVSFNGVVVMDNNIYEKEAPSLNNLSVMIHSTKEASENVLYKPNQIIKSTLANDTYHSSGSMRYKLHQDSISLKTSTRDNPIYNINYVKVHTPVICEPKITANNKRWVQLINPKDDYVPLVLDPDPTLSDFTVSISNTGKHSNRVGYYTRNMAWSLRKPEEVSYLDSKNGLYRNEVKFPFDVYYKKTVGEDEYIPKQTWITIGFNTPTFYLPMWVEEGEYTVQFRSIAVNATDNTKINQMTENYANTIYYNYVATNSIKVQVSGRIYGLTITDISDKREWEEVFHHKGTSPWKIDGDYESGVNKSKYNSLYKYDYTVGTYDQYGKKTDRLEKFTFPLVNGSHPKWTNIGIMKKGYSVNFRLTTIGNRYGSGDSVLIRPKFYYVDAQGKNRMEVDIYYTQYFNNQSNRLVKIGSERDAININRYRTDDLVPEAAWKTMADILNVPYNDYKTKKLDLFTYSKIRIYQPLMTYDNTDYLLRILDSNQYEKIKAAGVKQAEIMKRKQIWYGEYWLPADIHAVAKGFDVYDYSAKKGISYNESFWLKGGYIIINFEIVTVDYKGNEQLSYINQNNVLNGYCSMWNLENPPAYKVSYNGKAKKSVNFDFKPGDFLIYYTDISLRDDYTTYVIK